MLSQKTEAEGRNRELEFGRDISILTTTRPENGHRTHPERSNRPTEPVPASIHRPVEPTTGPVR